jgi:anti-sigma regulatory factor (Ser/Thr protein kinase)/anti-anti-sigma regulatory factor
VEELTFVSNALTWHVEIHDGHTLVTVNGEVDGGSGSALYRAVAQRLDRESGAVVVDLSDAGVTSPEAAGILTRLLDAPQLRLGTLVLVCKPGSATAAVIRAAPGQSSPLYATLAKALSALVVRDDIREVLLPVAGAARRARDIVTEACVMWDATHLVAPATIVVSELVTNVVMHARTMMTLQVASRPRYLYLAVADGSPAVPLPRTEDRLDVIGGRGLRLVDHAADRWGHRRRHDGKVVWARFALG